MQVNLKLLSKLAIDSALGKDWKKAVDYNLQILKKDPQEKDAKIRLGRAYIKMEKFTEAKRIFKEILEKDPINTIAQKNLKLASEHNPDTKHASKVSNSAKVLIKEPGTTTQVVLPATEKVLAKLEPGQMIYLKSFKNKLDFLLDKKRELGSIKDDVSQIVYNAKKKGYEVTASVVKPNKEHFTVLLKCKHPIFRSEKQLEKPYMKAELIDEPETEEVVEAPEEEI